MMATLRGGDTNHGIELTYAGIDLIKKAHNYEFSINNNVMETSTLIDKRAYIQGIRTWEFGFAFGRGIPDEGKVELRNTDHYGGEVFSAEGTAYISKGVLKTGFGHHGDLDIFDYTLTPRSAPLIFPDEELRRACVATAREEAYAAHAKAVQATMDQFKQVRGVWTVRGLCHYVPYSDDYDSMTEAIVGALNDIEWNIAYPESVECDGVPIFDRSDLGTLDYDAIMEDQ